MHDPAKEKRALPLLSLTLDGNHQGRAKFLQPSVIVVHQGMVEGEKTVPLTRRHHVQFGPRCISRANSPILCDSEKQKRACPNQAGHTTKGLSTLVMAAAQQNTTKQKSRATEQLMEHIVDRGPAETTVDASWLLVGVIIGGCLRTVSGGSTRRRL